MLSHVTIGTDDLDRAKAFYDPVIATLGIACIVDEPANGLVGYAEGPESVPQVYLIRPIDGRPAAVGNGQTFAFVAGDRATVRAFHAAALRAGGRCEGPPGLRPHYHPDDYGAHVRDPDGHKIACVCHLAEGGARVASPAPGRHSPGQHRQAVAGSAGNADRDRGRCPKRRRRGAVLGRDRGPALVGRHRRQAAASLATRHGRAP